jgi:hypothetical protein
MHDYKIYAVWYYCRQPAQSHRHRFTAALRIINSGKSYLDVRQASTTSASPKLTPKSAFAC